MPLRNNIFTNRNYKIRVLHILNHLSCLYAAYYFSWTGLAVAIALYYFFFGWGIDIGMHRLFSHRAFKTFRFYEYLLLVFASLATVGSSIAWVGMHRRHHRSSDGPEDPHSRERNLLVKCHLGKKCCLSISEFGRTTMRAQNKLMVCEG